MTNARAVGAVPARIAVREMLADVAQARGTQQRIDQRVQQHVAVGMRHDARGCARCARRRASTASPGPKACTSIPDPTFSVIGVRLRCARAQDGLRHGQILAIRDLDVAVRGLRPAGRRPPCHSIACASSVGVRAPATRARAARRAAPRAKHLRRLRPPQRRRARTVRSLRSAASARLTVSATGSGQQRTVRHRRRRPAAALSDRARSGRDARHRAPAPSRSALRALAQRREAVQHRIGRARRRRRPAVTLAGRRGARLRPGSESQRAPARSRRSGIVGDEWLQRQLQHRARSPAAAYCLAARRQSGGRRRRPASPTSSASAPRRSESAIARRSARRGVRRRAVGLGRRDRRQRRCTVVERCRRRACIGRAQTLPRLAGTTW